MSHSAWKWWLFALGIMCCTVLALPVTRFAFGEAGMFPVETLRVSGVLSRVTKEQVGAVVKPVVRGGWFAVDPKLVRTQVAQLPWVAQVEVRKSWPAAIEVRIVERDALARWGDTQMINKGGEIFDIGDVPEVQTLPKITGPDAMRHTLLAFFLQAEESLKPHRLSVSELNFSGAGGLLVRLSDGLIVKVGSTELDSRWQRFVLSYPQISAGQSDNPIAQVDLRYPHGLAVSWLPEADERGQVAVEARQ